MIDAAALIADMVRAGIDPDIIGRAAAAIAEAASMGANPVKDRTSAALRQERYRQRKASQTVTGDVTNNVTRDVTAPPALSPKKVSPTPPSKNNPLPNPQSSLAIANSDHAPDEFERWYAHFPNKVGKDAARRAWPKARKQASYEALCGGLRRYLAKTDDRQWCNPATWLNQARWLDEPATAPPKQPQLKGLALVREQLRQEIEDAGYSGEESPDNPPFQRLGFDGQSR